MAEINVALPNTIKEKMAAIVNLSEAIRNVAIALTSVNVEVTVSNNEITNGLDGTGIKINLEE